MRARLLDGGNGRGGARARRIVAASLLVAAPAALAAGESWTRLGDPATWAAPCRVGNESRPAASCDGSAGDVLRLTLPAETAGSRIELAAAIRPTAASDGAPGASRVRASVEDRAGGLLATLWERTLDPARPEDAGWQSATVALPEGAEAPVTLVLESSPASSSDAAPVAWARPVLRRSAPEPASIPGVVVIVLDGLRADRVLVGGRPHPGPPIVGRIARAGFVFTRAWAPTPDLGDSHVAMLTGRHACESGKAAGEATVGAQLAAAGWATAVVADDDALARLPGFDRVFTTPPDAFTDGVRVADRWLAEIGTAPFLLVVQTSQIGRPAALPPPVRARVRLDPGAPRTDRERAYYDAAVGWTDGGLGGLLGILTRRGLVGRAALVLTSAAGFELGEHGDFGVARSMHVESLHVPLVVHHPPLGRERQVPFPVELRDLPRTILDLAGIVADPATPGESLLPAMRGDTPGPRHAVADRPDASPRETALRTARFSWIARGDRLALYDLAADPTEQADVASEHRAVAAEGRERIRAFRARCAGRR